MPIGKHRVFLAALAAAVLGIALIAVSPLSWAARAPRVLGGEAADAARAMAHVEHLATTIGPRPAGTTSEAAAADYVAQRLSEYGYVVSRAPVRRSVAGGLCVSQNVVAVSPSPKPGARTILIAASIDSPAADSPGADDNASGVAAMLECARIAAGLNARHNLAFAAFGAGYMGRAGSKAIAEATDGAGIDPQDVIMAIVLDSVGRLGPIKLIPWGGPRALAPRAMAGLVRAVGGGRRFDATIGLLTEVRADHAPFLYAGIPAVALTTAGSVPYPAPGSLAPYWDSADSVDPVSVARAADAAMAAARWVSSETRIQAPVRPYLAFQLFGAVITIPYAAVLAVAAAAAALGILSLGPARYALYTEITRVRPEGYSQALAISLAVYIVFAAVLWTSFVPTLVLGVARGIERPWNAYPIPFAVAGTVCALFFAVAAVSLVGASVRDGVRLPLFRLSVLMQVALICFVFGATRIGAFFPAVGLLLTVAALAAQDGPARKLLAWFAPLPGGWLAIQAAQGVARHAVIDALEVPIVLCLLVAAVGLPYVLTLIALAPAGRGQDVVARAGGLGLSRDVMPGVTVREYSRRTPRGMPMLRRRRSPRAALVWALGVLAVILTSGLLLKPSYSPESPQYIHVVQNGNTLVFQSADNIRGVSVAGGPTGQAQRVDVGRSEFELPYSLATPAANLSVHVWGTRVSMSLSSGEPVAWVAFELEGSTGMEVASSERGYTVEKTRDSVKIRTVVAGESGPFKADLELSAPSGTQVAVRAVGGFRRNPSEIILSGTAKRFYQGNRFTTPAQRITI
jgi:Zn-dependent M28 family amino/carboxypeptidase